MRFAKYHGLGNDFVVLDRRTGGGPIEPQQAVQLCDRRRGIGADGVLTVLPSKEAAARMHVTNSDGSVAEMCGNGLRCVVKYLVDEGGERGERLNVETGAGVLACSVTRGAGGAVEDVTVDMGRPELEAARIPMTRTGRFVREEIVLADRRLRGTAVSMGNPHLVLFETARELAPKLASELEHHPLFPARVNVEFAAVNGDGIDVLVWERGCGFTEACGTGACATVVAAALEGRLSPGVERPVRLTGGVLHVRVLPDLSRVFMRGPAVRVFEGDVTL